MEKEITIEDVVKVARFGERVELHEKTIERINTSRKVIESILNKNEPVYGVNTGFGALANVKISDKELDELQRNILLSHAAGTGKPLSKEIVRAMLFLRAASLSKGFSGVRAVVIEKILELLNKDVYPFVPEKGSVGASGDLSPLAHSVLPLIGEGFVIHNGHIKPSKDALKGLNIKPISLKEKEGLALVNGTQAMTSILSIVIRDSERLLDLAVISSAISFVALNGLKDPLDERIHNLRPHKGQKKVAEKLRELLSFYEPNEKTKKSKVQDAYSLRTIPQVYGAVYDTIEFVKKKVHIEINSVTDNPLIFPEGEAISGGNFHGEPIALSADFLAIALTDLGNMIERRIDRMMNPKTNEGLPPFLAFGKSGLNSGLMLFQYTAAALCNENKTLSHPNSVDTIPTSAQQEDHVSMGMNSALKNLRILENLIDIVSIELFSAIMAIIHKKVTLKGILERVFSEISKIVNLKNGDKFYWEDFEKIKKWVKDKVRGKEEFWKD